MIQVQCRNSSSLEFSNATSRKTCPLVRKQVGFAIALAAKHLGRALVHSQALGKFIPSTSGRGQQPQHLSQMLQVGLSNQ